MSRWPPAMQLMGIGWYVATCIVFGVIGGVLLDDELGTGFALTLDRARTGTGIGRLGRVPNAARYVRRAGETTTRRTERRVISRAKPAGGRRTG